jgi:hypothetical protein
MQQLTNYHSFMPPTGSPGANRVPEARYSYYRRRQVFRRNGEQCKAPAEKGALICHAHAGQVAMAVRRERERRAVLTEAVAEMRRRGKPECEMADLFMDFKGIQVTLAVMAQALIDGRIDCKTAGRLVVQLQMISKLLWQIHRKARKGRKDLPVISSHDADQKKLPKLKLLPLISTDDKDRKKPGVGGNWAAKFPNGHASSREGARILPFEVKAVGDQSWAHGPPESKAA